MSPKKTLLIPFGHQLMHRPDGEKSNEEIYRSIPALNRLAIVAMAVSNKLSSEGRESLFYEKGNTDPELRVLKVEVAMIRRDVIENAQPDLEWMSSAKPISSKSFDTAGPDEWTTPPQP